MNIPGRHALALSEFIPSSFFILSYYCLGMATAHNSGLTVALQFSPHGMRCQSSSLIKKRLNLQNNNYLMAINPKFMTITTAINNKKGSHHHFDTLNMRYEQNYALEHLWPIHTENQKVTE
jgi:hypothetical protein